MSSTLLCTKNTCPPRLTSFIMASRIRSSLKSIISVWTGRRFGGGVFIMERSLAPSSENWRVRGIGVAVSVSVSTSTFNWRRRSFAATPNFCSSSIIKSPRSLNSIFLFRRRWVPIMISVRPSFRESTASLISFAGRRRLI